MKEKNALIIASPSSHSGKTLITLGLARALHIQGMSISLAKSGPDYIDTAFHSYASGIPSVNLDPWAMDQPSLQARAFIQAKDLLLVEGAMGVLDASIDTQGSVADLAVFLNIPVVLMINLDGIAQSAALPLAGLKALRPDVSIAGAILNKAKSEKHADMASKSIEAAGFKVFGAIRHDENLHLPSRHLGLVQAREMANLNELINLTARHCETLDLKGLVSSAAPLSEPPSTIERIPPLGQHIAVANDDVFTFCYQHLLNDWRDQGASVQLFSPSLGDSIPADADAIYLPGGYPELHCEKLSANNHLMEQLRRAARGGLKIYGECGGFMVLGEFLTDAQGKTWPMAGLLPVHTSFERKKLQMGYRRLHALSGFFHQSKRTFLGHEFHYSCLIDRDDRAKPLFSMTDAAGKQERTTGVQAGKVAGSYAHLIAPAAPPCA